jgi:hypothetical protein
MSQSDQSAPTSLPSLQQQPEEKEQEQEQPCIIAGAPSHLIEDGRRKKGNRGNRRVLQQHQQLQQQHQQVGCWRCCTFARGGLRTYSAVVAAVACTLLFSAQRFLIQSPNEARSGETLDVAESEKKKIERIKRSARGAPSGTPLKDARWRAALKNSGGIATCDILDGFDYKAMQSDGRLSVPQRPAIRWTHIPKTGQSFAYTMIKHGCPLVNLEKMHLLVNNQRAKELKIGVQDPSLNSFMQRVLQRRGCMDRGGPSGLCPHLLMPLRGHNPLKVPHYGQVVTMFREPHQRLISAAHMGTGCNKVRLFCLELLSYTAARPRFARIFTQYFSR